MTMMLVSAHGSLSDACGSPDKFVTPVAYQLDAARSPSAHVEQVAAQLDAQELDQHDRHGLRERHAEDFGVEP